MMRALLALTLLFLAAERVSVRLSPDRATVPVGGSVKLRAEVQGVSDGRVRWSLVGKNAVGRIADDGTYLAPATTATPATVMVRAASVANPTATATATIQLPEVKVEIQPNRSQLQLGESVQFRARVQNAVNQQATFAVEGKGRGVVSPGGVYAPPDTLQTPTTVIVRATSVADPSKSDTATIEVGAVEARITPDKARISVGGTMQFRASIRGAKSEALDWSVLGGAANGTVSESGLYRTPVPMVTPAKVVVRAASAADPSKYADAEVSVIAVELKVTPRPPGQRRNRDGGVFGSVVHSVTRLYLPFDPVSPILFGPIFRSKGGQLYLPAGGSYQFYAQAESTIDQRVRWGIEGDPELGTISESGLYVAPTRIRTPATVVIRATSEADTTKIGQTSLTIPPIVVRAEPRQAQVLAGANLQLKSEVQNSVNTAATWRIEGADNGTVTASGLYTAPVGVATPRTVTVTAVSVADPTKTAAVTVAIPDVQIALSPNSVELRPGESHKFQARVSNAANQSVQWKLDGPTEAGEVSAAGVFRASLGITEPVTLRVVATSVADPTKTAVAVVRVRPRRT